MVLVLSEINCTLLKERLKSGQNYTKNLPLGTPEGLISRTRLKKELWLIQENPATVKLDSSVTSRWMKTYSESRIELRNPQILKKMLDKSTQFLSSEHLCEPKSLDVASNIAGVEKLRPENLRLRSTWRPFDSSFEWKSVSDGGNLCPLWLVILKSVWNSVGELGREL